MEMNKQDFCLLVLPSITKALYKIGEKDPVLGFAAFKMLNDYAMTGEKPQGVDDNLALSVLFETIAPIIDCYRQKTEARRENGKKGGRPKKEQTIQQNEQPQTEESLQEQNSFFEEISTALNMPLQDAKYFYNKFTSECRIKGKTHKDKRDFQNHFFSWLKIKLKEQNEEEAQRRKYMTFQEINQENERKAKENVITQCMEDVKERLNNPQKFVDPF